MKTIFLSSFITINVFLILLTPAFPSDWKHIASAKDEEEYYVDFDTVEYSGTIVTFWGKGVNKKSEIWKSRLTINCDKRTFSVRDIILYASDGTLSGNYSYEKNLEWKTIPPDSVIEDHQKSLCKNK